MAEKYQIIPEAYKTIATSGSYSVAADYAYTYQRTSAAVRQLARTSDGGLVGVGIRRVDPGNYEAHGFYSTNGGSSWTDTGLLLWRESRMMSVCVDSNDVVYFAHTATYNQTGIFFHKFDWKTKTWLTTRSWTSGISTTASSLDVQIDKNDYLCALAANGSSKVLFSRSTDGGVTWSTNYQFAASSSGAVLRIDNNNRYHVAWLVSSTIYYSYSDDGGVTWSTTASFGFAGQFGMDIDANNIPHFIYASSGASINHRQYSGGAFSNAVNLITESNCLYPDVSINTDGTIYALWQRYGMTDFTYKAHVKYSTSTDGGATWAAVTTLLSDATYKYGMSSMLGSTWPQKSNIQYNRNRTGMSFLYDYRPASTDALYYYQLTGGTYPNPFIPIINLAALKSSSVKKSKESSASISLGASFSWSKIYQGSPDDLLLSVSKNISIIKYANTNLGLSTADRLVSFFVDVSTALTSFLTTSYWKNLFISLAVEQKKFIKKIIEIIASSGTMIIDSTVDNTVFGVQNASDNLKSIARDSSGNLYTCQWEYDPTDQMSVYKSEDDGATWSLFHTLKSGVHTIGMQVLADADDRIHVLWVSGSNVAEHAVYDGSWSSINSIGTSAYGLSSCLDSDGRVHAITTTINEELKYYIYDTDDIWYYQNTFTIDGGYAIYQFRQAKIDVDSMDDFHVVFTRHDVPNTGILRTCYVKIHNTVWGTYEVLNNVQGGEIPVILCSVIDDSLHVVAPDNTNGGIIYHKNTGSGWSAALTLSTDAQYAPAISESQDGHIHVYSIASTDVDMIHMEYDGANWSEETVKSFTPDDYWIEDTEIIGGKLSYQIPLSGSAITYLYGNGNTGEQWLNFYSTADWGELGQSTVGPISLSGSNTKFLSKSINVDISLSSTEEKFPDIHEKHMSVFSLISDKVIKFIKKLLEIVAPSGIDLGDGLIMHFKMNENDATNVAVDSSPVENDAYLYDNEAEIGTYSLYESAGKINSAFYTSPYIHGDVAHNAAYEIVDGKMTIAVWVSPTAEAIDQIILSKYDDEDPGKHIDLWLMTGDTGNKYLFCDFSDGDNYLQIKTVKDDNICPIAPDWTHIAVVLDLSGDCKFYVNGVDRTGVLGTIPASFDFSTLTAPWRLFTWADTSEWTYYDGTADDVRVYHKALSQAEISAIYNDGNGTEEGWSVGQSTFGPITLSGINFIETSKSMVSTTQSTAEKAIKAIGKLLEIVPAPQSSQIMHLKFNEDTTDYIYHDTSPVAAEGTCNMVTEDAAGDSIIIIPPHYWGISLDCRDNAYVDFPDNDAYHISSAFSFAGWLNMETLPPRRDLDPQGYGYPLFCKDTSDYSDPLIWIYLINQGTSSDQVEIDLQANDGTSSTNVYTDPTLYSIPAGQWVHFAFVVDGIDNKIYIDGVDRTHSLSEKTNLPNLSTNTDQIQIGIWSDYTHPLNGRMDDFRWYKKALTETEVLDIYNGGSGTEDELVVLGGTSYGGLQFSGQQNKAISKEINVQTSLSVEEINAKIQSADLAVSASKTIKVMKGSSAVIMVVSEVNQAAYGVANGQLSLAPSFDRKLDMMRTFVPFASLGTPVWKYDDFTKDTYVKQVGDQGFPTAVNLITGWESSSDNIILIGPALTSMPNYGTKVVLSLYCFEKSTLNPTIEIKVNTSSWIDAATWSGKPTTTETDKISYTITSTGWKDIDITDIYNKWQTGELANNGISIIATNSGDGAYAKFSSSNSTPSSSSYQDIAPSYYGKIWNQWSNPEKALDYGGGGAIAYAGQIEDYSFNYDRNSANIYLTRLAVKNMWSGNPTEYSWSKDGGLTWSNIYTQYSAYPQYSQNNITPTEWGMNMSSMRGRELQPDRFLLKCARPAGSSYEGYDVIYFAMYYNQSSNFKPYLDIQGYDRYFMTLGGSQSARTNKIIDASFELIPGSRKGVVTDASVSLGASKSVKLTKNSLSPTTAIFNVGPGDGEIGYIDATSWSQAHDATVGNHGSSSLEAYYIGVVKQTSSGRYYIFRGFLPVDTSTLGIKKNILDAKLYIESLGIQDGITEDGKKYFTVVQTSQASPTTLTNADYDNCGAVTNPDQGSDQIHLSTFTPGWHYFTLNATGLSWISRNGYTMLGIREGHDCENINPPAPEFSEAHSDIHIYGYEHGTAYLYVTYTETPTVTLGASVNIVVKKNFASAMTLSANFSSMKVRDLNAEIFISNKKLIYDYPTPDSSSSLIIGTAFGGTYSPTQEFISQGGYVKEIDLVLVRSTGDSTLTLNVYAAAGDGKPTGPSLYSHTYAENEQTPVLGTIYTVTHELTTPLAITYGSKYVVQLSATGAGFYNWKRINTIVSLRSWNYSVSGGWLGPYNIPCCMTIESVYTPDSVAKAINKTPININIYVDTINRIIGFSLAAFFSIAAEKIKKIIYKMFDYIYSGETVLVYNEAVNSGSYTVTAGTDLLVVTYYGLNLSQPSITFNGIPLTVAAHSQAYDANTYRTGTAYLVNPPVGTYTMVGAPTGKTYSVSGIDTVNPVLYAEAPVAGGYGGYTKTFTPGGLGGVVFDTWGTNNRWNGETLDPATGQTRTFQWETNPGNMDTSGSYKAYSGESVTIQWIYITGIANNYVTWVIFKAADVVTPFGITLSPAETKEIKLEFGASLSLSAEEKDMFVRTCETSLQLTTEKVEKSIGKNLNAIVQLQIDSIKFIDKYPFEVDITLQEDETEGYFMDASLALAPSVIKSIKKFLSSGINLSSTEEGSGEYNMAAGLSLGASIAKLVIKPASASIILSGQTSKHIDGVAEVTINLGPEEGAAIELTFETTSKYPMLHDYDSYWVTDTNIYEQTLTLNLDCTPETNCIVTMISAPAMFSTVPTFNGIPMTHLGSISTGELCNVDAYYIMDPAVGPGVLSYYSLDPTGGDICVLFTGFAYNNVIGLPILHTTNTALSMNVNPTAACGAIVSQAATGISGIDYLTPGPGQTLIRAEKGGYRSKAASVQTHDGVTTNVSYTPPAVEYWALLAVELSGEVSPIGITPISSNNKFINKSSRNVTISIDTTGELIGMIFNAVMTLYACFKEDIYTPVLWLRAMFCWMWNRGMGSDLTLNPDITIRINKINNAFLGLYSDEGARWFGIADAAFNLIAEKPIRFTKKVVNAVIVLLADMIKMEGQLLQVAFNITADKVLKFTNKLRNVSIIMTGNKYKMIFGIGYLYLTLIPDMSKKIGNNLRASIVMLASIRKKTSKILEASLSLIAKAIKKIGKYLATGVTLTADIFKKIMLIKIPVWRYCHKHPFGLPAQGSPQSQTWWIWHFFRYGPHGGAQQHCHEEWGMKMFAGKPTIKTYWNGKPDENMDNLAGADSDSSATGDTNTSSLDRP